MVERAQHCTTETNDRIYWCFCERRGIFQLHVSAFAWIKWTFFVWGNSWLLILCTYYGYGIVVMIVWLVGTELNDVKRNKATQPSTQNYVQRHICSQTDTRILWSDEEVTHNITDIHYYSAKESDFNYLHIEETWILCLFCTKFHKFSVLSFVLKASKWWVAWKNIFP